MGIGKWPNLTNLILRSNLNHLSWKWNWRCWMLILKQRKLEKPDTSRPLYLWFYPADNSIGNDACRYLSKTVWSNLIFIDLGSDVFKLGENKISNEGCQHLANSCWKKVVTFYLCKDLLMTGNNIIGDEGCMHLSKM